MLSRERGGKGAREGREKKSNEKGQMEARGGNKGREGGREVGVEQLPLCSTTPRGRRGDKMAGECRS